MATSPMNLPGMTLEQLRIFVAVAERQHVTRAAEALHLSQSAVSSAVSAIEARFATRLFDRVGRRIELTDAGRIFLTEARAVLLRSASAEAVLADLAGLRRGTLRVQASQTIASHWLPRHLVSFRRRFPDIAISLAIGNTAEVAAAVLEGAAELGFVEGTVEDPALASLEVAEDELVLVTAPGHALASIHSVSSQDLIATDWVMREVGSGTRSAFEAALAPGGIDPASLRVVLEMPSNEAVRAAVEAGAGASVLSRSVVAPALLAGTLVAANYALPTRAFRVLRHKERYRTVAGEALLALIGDAAP